MRKLIKNFIQDQGFSIIRVTPRERVESLIKRLHPKAIDKELIRVGPVGDGGYLLPDDLSGIKACFSPGVGPVSLFEKDCLDRGMKVFMADKSVDGPKLDVPKEKYSFIKKFVGCVDNNDYITMDKWVETYYPEADSDMLLQMDIEGAEYYTLLNMSEALMNRFRIIVIEFHTLHHLWNPIFFDLAENVFDRVLHTHACVHNHPNNCCGIETRFGVDIPRVIELTFLRKDRVKLSNKQLEFPHKLDSDNYINNPEKGHIVLPKNWYSAASGAKASGSLNERKEVPVS